ncbi:MAG: hypothetical protein GY832_46300 [Chloroflexi bacterium]|nr:hypothetical protein [Chloroflexota bacterium]
MPTIPPFILKKLYVKGSLRAEENSFGLDLENSIAPATILAFTGLNVDDQPVPPAQITVIPSDGQARAASDISGESPLSFPADATITLRATGQTLDSGPHEIAIHVVVQDVGLLNIPISDTLT